MNRILLAAVASLGFAGAAAAQQPPLHGNYSQNVLERHSQTNGTAPVDRTATASVERRDAAPANSGPADVFTLKQKYGGR